MEPGFLQADAGVMCCLKAVRSCLCGKRAFANVCIMGHAGMDPVICSAFHGFTGGENKVVRAGLIRV